MNKLSQLVLLLFVFLNDDINAQAQFTITAADGYTINCFTPTLNFSANGNAANSYSWTNGVVALTGSNVAINVGGTYTILSQNASNTASQTIAIQVNTTIPVVSTPSVFQVLSPIMLTLTAISPTVNIFHTVVSAIGGTNTSFTNPYNYFATQGSLYLYYVTNLVNGCTSCQVPVNWNIIGVPATITGLSEWSQGNKACNVEYNRIESEISLTTLNINQSAFEIWSSDGKLVNAAKFVGSALIDCSMYSSGLYSLRIFIENKVQVERILIQQH